MVEVVGKDISAEERWAAIAEDYLANVEGPYHLHRREVIKSLYKDLDLCNKKVLDFGCGEAFILKDILSSEPEKVVGIDINEKLLEYAKVNLKGYKNYELIKADITHLQNFESCDFDLVLALNVIGYFSDSEEKLFYNMVGKLLKPGGRLIVCHSNELFDLYTFNRHTLNFVSNYLSNVPKDKLTKLITNPDAPKKVSANIRENPLNYKFKMKAYGFTEEKQAFANFHEVPPLLMDERLFVKDINDRFYQDTTNWPEKEKWKLMFQCSMYASRLILD